MAFFKFRARGPAANEGRNTSVAAAPAESVDTMRRRARHRLLGAAVLVLIGVVGFPLLFDTQPRPVAVDIPIEIPDRNKAKPLALPSAPPVAATSPSTSGPVTGSGAGGAGADGTSPNSVTAESAAPVDVAPSRPAPSAAARESRPAVSAEPKPEATAEARSEPKPGTPKPAAADDGARARALLEGKPSAAAVAAASKPPAPSTTPAVAATAAAPASDDAGRFVVQVGAFADAAKAREVRQKLEKAGLKTFTNVAKTADGERTRVRVGPFASRAEADRAASRIKGLSLTAAVLTL